MLTLLEEEDIHILDKPMETNMAEIGDKPDWLNLPDLAFNEIMMRVISLCTCMQVCSSWKERITKNILENPTKKNIIRARIERAIMTRQLISDCIFEAHQMTCHLSTEQIQLKCSQGINESEVKQFMNMVSAFIIFRHLLNCFLADPRESVDQCSQQNDGCYQGDY